jgi:hypothetical protein
MVTEYKLKEDLLGAVKDTVLSINRENGKYESIQKDTKVSDKGRTESSTTISLSKEYIEINKDKFEVIGEDNTELEVKEKLTKEERYIAEHPSLPSEAFFINRRPFKMYFPEPWYYLYW